MSTLPRWWDYLRAVPDPRMERTKRYPLIEILFVALCAVICGAEGFVGIAAFGESKLEWLRTYLPFQAGIASHDTFRRVLGLIDPEAFERCFRAWTQALHEHTQGEVLALDGKVLCHSLDQATGQAPLHLVSAWASAQGVCWGQVAVESKHNEITALPALLRLLEIRGCLVTMDAMGCQKAIAQQIIAQGGDYVLALKSNQTSVYEDVALFFEDARAHGFFAHSPTQRIAYRYHETLDKGHGRLEIRRVWVVADAQIAWLEPRTAWAGLRSLIAVERERLDQADAPVETRYFLSSRGGSARQLAEAIRAHWGIENGLHYRLDVTFGEDACCIRKAHAPRNVATLRRIALQLLVQDTTTRLGVKTKRQKAGWDTAYLTKILLG